MIEAGLVLSRALHYISSLVLFGLVLFPLYAYARPAGPAASVDRWVLAMPGWAALAALLSGVLWFAAVVVSMTDGAFDWEAIRSVLMETSFGEVSIIRFILATVIVVLMAFKTSSPVRHPDWLSTALCAGLAASLAGTGHTQSSDGVDRFIHTVADGLHLLAAGAWLGGLVALFGPVVKSLSCVTPAVDAEARNAALRFAIMGYAAVATLIASGLINSWFLVGSFSNLTSTAYGQLLLVKLLLFAGMLALAAVNRFVVVPELTKGGEFGGHAVGLTRLRRRILGEQALGLLIILVVSRLATMEPAVN